MSKQKMLSYWDYLSLDVILNSQHPKTDAHDEPLFIMIHQTFEVWFKLLIFELRETIKQLHAGDAAKAAHYLHRVNTILGISAHGFHVRHHRGMVVLEVAVRPAKTTSSVIVA